MSDQVKVLSNEEIASTLRKAQSDFNAVRDSVIGFRKDEDRDTKALDELRQKMLEKYGTSSVAEMRERVETLRRQNSAVVLAHAERAADALRRVTAINAALQEMEARK